MSEPKPEVSSAPGFADLELSKDGFRAIRSARYHEPTPVQGGMIPYALKGQDVMAQACTGTGKTAAFAIPILESIDLDAPVELPKALVLVPTRELAVQVRDEFEKLQGDRDITCVALYGGKPIRKQVTQLREGADVIVGTPGRVLDHLGRKSLDLSGLTTVVLDEADRMLDIGFRPDIEKILRRCPSKRQTMLLSATVAPPVARLAKRYMTDPVVLNFSPEVAADTIDQHYFTVEREKKFDLLVRLLDRDKPAQAIVFCRTRRGTEKIYRRLLKWVKDIDCIHGDMQQRARDRVMKKFREGNVKTLVATDVVGRGIDVTGISHIINYDIPESCDDYVHRVGRTGRMGREGMAYTFVTPEEGAELTRIEMRVNKLLKRGEIQGFETYVETASSTSTKPPTSVQTFGFDAQPDGEKARVRSALPPTSDGESQDKGKKRYRRAL